MNTILITTAALLSQGDVPLGAPDHQVRQWARERLRIAAILIQESEEKI